MNGVVTLCRPPERVLAEKDSRHHVTSVGGRTLLGGEGCMSAPQRTIPTSPATMPSDEQSLSDPQLSQHHENDVALRHRSGASLSRARTGRADPIDRDREHTVTRALTLPDTEEEAPGGADPLPGQLDRWLTSRGAELVAVRRHIHAHPELSRHEFETTALIARELAKVGLSPRILPKGTGVLCDIGQGDQAIALRADI